MLTVLKKWNTIAGISLRKNLTGVTCVVIYREFTKLNWLYSLKIRGLESIKSTSFESLANQRKRVDALLIQEGYYLL